MTRLDDRLAALADMPSDEVRAEWERVREGTAPKLPVGMLRLLIATTNPGKLRELAGEALGQRSRCHPARAPARSRWR